MVSPNEKLAPAGQNLGWGRRKRAGWSSTFGSLIMMAMCPTLVSSYWIALEYFDGSLTQMCVALYQQGLSEFTATYRPRFSTTALYGYAIWLIAQAVLYRFLPGKTIYGQKTPQGHVVVYCANGLLAWAVTHAAAWAAVQMNIMDPAIIANHWAGLLIAVNAYGFVLTVIAYFKALWAPSSEREFSGSRMYDLFMGIELNPSFGKNWDFKFFHNGRVGLLAWTLIDLSWAAYQYQQFGYVSDSMKVLIILHALYAVDFFVNEDWYVRTIDITHDHFGFYFAWGDTTWLPSMYTLQAQYLARRPSLLLSSQSLAILVLGCMGYALFRSANHQKDLVRRKQGDCKIWGKQATFIKCSYQTSDGKTHQSLLLTSGWWGTARHSNYFADLVQCWAMCATCGFDNILPWFYFIYMALLLWHRAGRDERRCAAKYGAAWDEYVSKVPYRLIPGIL